MLHKFSMSGLYFALDVYSGAVHLLDELSYRLLDYTDENMTEKCPQEAFVALSDYSEDEIKNTYKELYGLYCDGILHSADTYAEIAAGLEPAPVKSMCLNIAHDCNLRCEYCFAAKGDFGKGRKLMPASIGKKAIDFMLENSGDRHNLELDFFGGEPLMNFDVVKEVVAYAREREKAYGKNFRFTITTNGMLLDDDKIEYINKEMSNVVLSIDGRKEVNDRVRYTAGNKGSYDVIMPKYKKLVATRGEKDYYARGTFTKYNLDFSEDVMHLYEQGFSQISVEPAVCDLSLPYALTEEDLPRILEEYEKLAHKLAELKNAGKQINFFHFMVDFDGGPCAIKRLRGCSCGNEYVAVTPEGDIYPCHQFVGMDEYKMGNLEDGTFNQEIKNTFSKINVYQKEECRNCFAKFFCSGGCTANNLIYAASLYKPFRISCEMQRKRVECSILLKALTM